MSTPTTQPVTTLLKEVVVQKEPAKVESAEEMKKQSCVVKAFVNLFPDITGIFKFAKCIPCCGKIHKNIDSILIVATVIFVSVALIATIALFFVPVSSAIVTTIIITTALSALTGGSYIKRYLKLKPLKEKQKLLTQYQSTLETTQSVLESTIEEEKEKLNLLKTEVGTLHDENEVHQKLNEEQAKAHAKIQKDMSAQLAAKQVLINQFEEKLAYFQAQLKVTNENLERHQTLLTEQANANRAQSETLKQYQAANQKQSDLIREHADTIKRQKEAQTKLEGLSSRQTETIERHESAIAEHLEALAQTKDELAEIQKLKTQQFLQNQRLKSTLAESSGQLDSLRESVSHHRSEVSRLHSANGNLAAQLAQQKVQHEAQVAELNQTKTQLGERVGELERVLQYSVDEQLVPTTIKLAKTAVREENAVKELEKQVAQLRVVKDKLTDEVARLHEVRTGLDETLEKYQRALATTGNLTSSSEIQEIKAALQKLAAGRPRERKVLTPHRKGQQVEVL